MNGAPSDEFTTTQTRAIDCCSTSVRRDSICFSNSRGGFSDRRRLRARRLAHRHMVREVRRRLPRYVCASFDAVGIAFERNDQALEPEFRAQHQRHRARQHHPLRDRWICGDHLLRFGVGQLDVGQLPDPGRWRLVERTQDLLTRPSAGAHRLARGSGSRVGQVGPGALNRPFRIASRSRNVLSFP